MVYQLKKIRYKGKDYHILLQNENGPCPLLAAVNCLILKGSVTLPSNFVKSGIATIDQLVNVLGEKILTNHSGGEADHHIQEVLTIFPSLQFGMDVNPKFTAGPTGVEYTLHLNAFDLLHVELVHGWLIEPDAEEYDFIGNQTYNQLINVVIEGNDASSALHSEDASIHSEIDRDALSSKATKGSIVNHFLDRSAHQLTQYGLTTLHEYLSEGQLVVFFRNNHFNTLTKHDGLLYLLVTDQGYANVSSVIWEKLDVIDGDTEYVNANFKIGPSLSNSKETSADYQLALQLSREISPPSNNNSTASGPHQSSTGEVVSDESDIEAAQRASLEEYNKQNPESSLPMLGSPNTIENATERSRVYFNAMGQQVNSATEKIIKSAGDSLQEVANLIQPMGFNETVDKSASVQSENNNAGAMTGEEKKKDQQPSIAIDPSNNITTQEEQDLILALQLQRNEENERTQRQSQQRNQGRKSDARTGPSAQSKRGSGKDANCTIS